LTQSRPFAPDDAIKVLHVDDEESQSEFVRRFISLSDSSIQVFSTLTPEEALARLEEEAFDCVISDYQMPRMDGIELARIIRETSDIPIIIYTGRGSEEVAEAAFTVGVDDYLRKELNPSHYQVLARRIRSAVERFRVKDELRDSEEKYRNLVENANQAILVYQDGSYKFANARATEISGYTEEELLSITPSDLVHPEDFERLAALSTEIVSRRLNGEDPPDSPPFRFVTKGGETRWVEFKSININWDGRLAGLNFFTDITDRKSMEEEVRESEEKYRGFVENSRDGVEVFTGTELVYSNLQAARLHGAKSVEEFLEKGPLSFVHPEDREEIPSRATARQRGEDVPPVFDFRVIPPDGEIRWLESSSSLIEFQGEKSILTFLRDVTDREAYLGKLEALHRHVSELASATGMKDVAETTFHALDEILGFEQGGFGVVEGDELDFFVRWGLESIPRRLHLGGPVVTVRAVKTGKPQYVPDSRLDPDFVDWDDSQILSEYASPIMQNGTVVAVINIESTAIDGFTEEDKRIVEIFSEHVATAMSRLKSYELLQSSEEKFRTFLNETRDAVFVLDDEKYIYSNQYAAELLGFDDPSEVIGRDAFEFVAPEDREKVREITSRRQSGEDVPNRYEFSLVEKEGVRIPVEVNVSLIEYEGKPVSLAINRDITERKLMEEALRKSEGEKRLILERSPDAIVVYDDEVFLYLNRKAAILFGYDDPADLIGKPFIEFLPEHKRASNRYESHIRRGDGSSVDVEFRIETIVFDGKLGILNIIQDITEQKKIEEELKHSESEKLAILDAIPDSLSLKDADYRFIWANKALVESTGVALNELIGKVCYEVVLGREEPCDECTFHEAMNTGERAQGEQVSEDGRISECIVVPIRDVKGNVTSAVDLSRDVTERAQFEDELRKSEERLRRFMDSATEGFAILDGDLNYVDVNDALMRRSGRSREEYIGKNMDELFPDIHETGRYDEYMKVIETGNPFHSEILRSRYGHRRIMVYAFKMPEGLGIISTDVSEVTEYQDALRKSEEKWRGLLDSSMDGVTVNIKTRLVYTNQRFAEMMGYKREELIGTSILDLHTEQYRDLIKERTNQRQKGTSEPSRYEVQLLKKDGGVLDVEYQVSLIDYEGEAASLTYIRDITEHKCIENELTDSEDRLRRFMESATEAFAIFDSDMNFLDVNTAALRSSGTKKEDIMGRNLKEVIPYVVETGRYEQYLDVIRTGKPLYISEASSGPQTGDRYISINAFKVREGLGLITTDITELKQYEARLEALHRHATDLASVDSVEEIAGVTLRVIKDVFGFQWSDFNVIKDDKIIPLLIQDEALGSNMELPLGGPGIINRAYKTGESQLIHDTRLDEDYVIGRSEAGEEWLSELAVPVKAGDEVVAVINVGEKALGAFTPSDQKLLEVFAEHVASAMDRLETMNALRSSEEKFRTLLEESRDAVFVLDHERFLYANQSAAELLGFSDSGELIGGDAFEFVAPEDRENVREMALRRQKMGEEVPSRYEFSLVDKEGSRIPVETNTSLIEYEGKPGSLSINRVITERKRYEETLVDLHSHAELLSGCDSLEEVHGLTLEAMEKTLGFDRVDILMVEGDSLVQVAAHENLPRGLELPLDGKGVTVKAVTESRSILVNDIKENDDYVYVTDQDTGELMKGYQVSQSELAAPIVIQEKAVGVLNVESLRMNAFTEQDQTLLEMLPIHVASAIDRLTKVGELERLVAEKTRELLESERMGTVGRVASMVGHDLRGPLQTIKNSLYMMRKNSEGGDLVETMDAAVDYAAEILEDLRFSTLEVTPMKHPTDLAELLERALAESSIPDKIDVKTKINEGLERVSLDPTQIRRVLDNLIRNAVEAIPKGGGLEITARGEGENVLVEISDTGVGIPEDEMENLFKPLYTTKPGGMGMGLAYCKRAVEAHGGEISVESTEGEGSKFTVRLPAE